MSANNDKRTQSIYSIETYVYDTDKYLAFNKEEIYIIKQYKK